MRKTLIGWLTAMALILTLIPSALAAEDTVVTMKAGNPWCVVREELVLLDPENRAVVPLHESGRTLVPIRRVLEAFGGEAAWDSAKKCAVCTLDGNKVELTPGAMTAQVNGQAVPLDVPAKVTGGRTFVPIRFVSENLGLQVGYDTPTGIVVISRTAYEKAALTSLPQVQKLHAKAAVTGDPVTFRSGSFQVASGAVKANIITVDMKDTRVSVKTAVVDNALNRTRSFKDIVAGSKPVAAVNGNFFASYSEVKDPIGHVMSNGKFLYGNSGLTSLGFTADNQMRWGRPATFTRIRTADGAEWSAYSVNTQEQTADGSVLYTPARGGAVTAKVGGGAMTIQGGQITEYRTVAAGESLPIPAGGYVFLMGSGFTGTSYFRTPVVGSQVTLEPYLRVEDTEGFTLDGVTDIISGAPRLVRNGAMETHLEAGFTEARFTTSVTPRTAVGTTKDGKLVLVNTAKASIQQMRELMLQLGCVEAMNLDGGASTGMYYKGKFVATPGRELTTTLQVFVDG